MKPESMEGRQDCFATMSVEAAGVGGSAGRGIIARKVDDCGCGLWGKVTACCLCYGRLVGCWQDNCPCSRACLLDLVSLGGLAWPDKDDELSREI